MSNGSSSKPFFKKKKKKTESKSANKIDPVVEEEVPVERLTPVVDRSFTAYGNGVRKFSNREDYEAYLAKKKEE